MRSPRMLVAWGVVAALAVALIAEIALPRSLPAPDLVRVSVGGQPRLVPRGTTFDQAVRAYSLWPRPGDLLNVQGQPVRPGIDPGYNTLDGSRVTDDPVLRDGQVVGVVNGTDRTEHITRVVIPIPAGEPGNPQFFLGNVPGEQIVRRGEISGVVVSSEFRATGPARQPERVALTFDDGPWPATTADVLGILQRMHVQATFFDVGYLARERPDLVRQELDAGMLVGNHSWDHPITPPFRDLSHARIASEIGRTNTELASIGPHPQLFRPPGGSYSPWVLQEAARQHVRVVLWSVDPRDWEPGTTARHIVHSVLSHVRPGSIVLLHDGGGDRSATVKALPRIIRGIRRMGLQFAVPQTSSQ